MKTGSFRYRFPSVLPRLELPLRIVSSRAVHDVLNTASRRRAGEFHSCFQITSLVWLGSVPARSVACVHERTHVAVYMAWFPAKKAGPSTKGARRLVSAGANCLFGRRDPNPRTKGALHLEPRNKSRIEQTPTQTNNTAQQNGSRKHRTFQKVPSTHTFILRAPFRRSWFSFCVEML